MTFLNWVQEATGCKVEDDRTGMIHTITGGKFLADSPLWPMIELTDETGVVRFATLDRFEEMSSVGSDPFFCPLTDDTDALFLV